MRHRFFFFQLLLLSSLSACLAQPAINTWRVAENKAFTLHFTAPDSALVPLLTDVLLRGVAENAAFFGKDFPKRFDVWCFPDRACLDRQWQHDWGDSTFQSACWMVASGVAHRLDLLTPLRWDTQACEHANPFVVSDTGVVFRTEKAKTTFQRLLTHELTHVYHGQHCRTPDFTGMDALGWWVEGLATYVSGQLDSTRLARVKTLSAEGKAPAQLEQFWSGPQRYGLSGSVVAALDAWLGRERLLQLLPLNSPEAVFSAIQLDEAGVLKLWSLYLARL